MSNKYKKAFQQTPHPAPQGTPIQQPATASAMPELSQCSSGFRGVRSIAEFKTRKYAMCDYVPVGMGFTLFCGANDVGKSSLVERLASRIMLGTAEGVWHGTPHSVLFVLSEEDPATVGIALQALGVARPLQRKRALVYVTGDTASELGDYDVVTLPDDVAWLREVAAAKDVKLVVFDALVESMGSANLNDRADVSKVFRALNKWAAEDNILIVGVHHNNKTYEGNAKQAVAGSAAFTDKARTVVTVDKDSEGRRVMSLAKVKGMATNPNYEFQFISRNMATDDGGERMVGVVDHIKTTNMSVDKIREERQTQANKTHRTETGEVQAWLESELAEGPLTYREIMKDAKATDFSERQLRNAKDCSNGRIVSHLDPNHTGRGKATVWELSFTDTTPLRQ